ncbi:hypothetical protein PZ938_04475 [Luteipulveratus sp. YIM 133132]|uniref:hypothetical protein n=1 Tax=Luteipulveratus flavus TaxID=3031728 RepID=UPI0023B1B89F|nr:hypothetical protein [Luteipulveratus sp. YIM 133132]MDE9364851.1 hypothetical protein [Luteipulveratus sp. YIM 133132]
MAEISEDLDAVAEELYAVLPGDFVATRDARVKQARSDGDRELATQIKALRRPNVAAWLVNVLARSDGGLDDLTDLSTRLRDAQSRLDGAAMKALGQERGQVVTQLATRAATLGAEADPSYKDSAAAREQVVATLNAAVADPAAEQAVASGRLVNPLSYAGFGEVDLTDAVATPLRSVPEQSASRKAKPGATHGTARTRDATEESTEPAEVEPEAEPDAEVDEKALAAARQRLTAAERKLAVAEEAFAQARSRRHQARLEVEKARLEVEEIEDA